MANSRRAIAEQLLKLQHRIAPDLLRIDGYKDQLRTLADTDGESFTEEVEGLGSVEVKAGAEAKFKGIVPTLKPEAFLGLTEAKRKQLIDAGVVAMEHQYTQARKASVTVRL